MHQIFEQRGHENERKFWKLKNKVRLTFFKLCRFDSEKHL